jgi:hypothetical protein
MTDGEVMCLCVAMVVVFVVVFLLIFVLEISIYERDKQWMSTEYGLCTYTCYFDTNGDSHPAVADVDACLARCFNLVNSMTACARPVIMVD